MTTTRFAPGARRFWASRLGRAGDHFRLSRNVQEEARAGAPSPEALAAVRAELAHASFAPFDAGAIDRQYRKLVEWDPRHAARLVYDGRSVTFEASSSAHERALWVAWAVELVARAHRLPEFKLLAYIGDELARDMEHFPVLCFCRRAATRGQILIPDFEALRGYERLEHTIDRAADRFPWPAKEPLAFWRGASTGGRFEKPTWRQIPRARLVAVSLSRPDLVDARFVSLAQGADQNSDLAVEGFLGTRVSPIESLRYRYLVDADGNGSSWSRMVWLLRSNSLLLKQKSPYLQWYYPLLEPGRHYVETAPDFSDLASLVEWARQNDEEARSIAEAGSRFARERLSRPRAFSYLAAVLRVLCEATGATA